MNTVVDLLLKSVKFACVFLALCLGAYSHSALAAYVTMTPNSSTTGDLEVKITPYTGGCSAPPGGVCLRKWTSLQVTHNNQAPSGHEFTNLGNNTYSLKVTKPGSWKVIYKLHKRIGEEPYPCDGDPHLLDEGTPVTRAGDTCYFVERTETSTLGSDTSTVANPVGNVSFTSLPTELDAADGTYTISWKKPTGAVEEYVLEEKVGSGGTFSNVTLSSKLATSYTPPSPKAKGQTYYYRIKACNKLECSTSWTPASIKVRTNEKPTVSWVESPHGKSYRPDALPTLYMKATDFNGIKSVEFFRDNGVGSGKYSLGMATPDNNKCTGCFRLNWSSSSLSDTVKVWAEAKDNLNAINPTSKATVSVLENEAPTAWLLSPPSNLTQYDSVTLSAEANDADGSVVSVEFLVDGSSLGIDNSAPYQKPWSPEEFGSFQLKVKVTDNEGATWTSNASPVTVDALDRPDPPAGLTIDDQLQPIPDNTTGNYTVDWEPVADATYQLKQFKVDVDTEFQPVTLANDKVPGQYITNRTSGRYRYRAYACNRAGCSDPSAEIALNVVKEKSQSPEGLVATPTPAAGQFTGSFNLEWDPITVAPIPNNYKLQEKAGGLEAPGDWVTLNHNKPATSFPIELKEPGTYSYQVLACNAAGCSEPGEVVTITVLPPRLTAASLACDGACVSLTGPGLDPNATLELAAVHDPSVQVIVAAGDLTWHSETEIEAPIQVGSALYDAMFELGVRATVTNPNGARSGITVYGDRATEIIGETQSAPALAADGTLYVGAGKNLYALDATDGSVKPAWPFATGGIIKASPRVDGVDGTVYIGSLDHSLYAVTPDANQKWRLETGGEVVSSVVLDEERVLYFGSMDKVLYAVNAQNGSIKWTFPANDGIAKTPILAGDNILYFTTVNSNQVYAISRGLEGPGKLVWESVDDSLIWEEIGEWQPSPSERAEFLSVARLYRGLLQPPLPFSKKILTFWTYQLIGGQTNLVDMAEAFLESGTGRANFSPRQSHAAFVSELYERMFPDEEPPALTSGGIGYTRAMLLDMLANGYSRAQVATLFAQSNEYAYATSGYLGHSFDFLYEQDFDWVVTDCAEGEAYTRDCDGDGLPDWWEILFLGTTEFNGDDDPDGDDITNDQAFHGNLSPCAGGCNNGIVDKPPAAPASAPDITQTELTASQAIGSLPGKFRVNEAGAATYSIPLNLPAGTAGVAPELALNYSSQSGNGLLGQGWALKGLSAISRCRKTLGQDGESAPIAWDAEDRFCLDGQRLLLVSGGSYGDSGSQYRTELDSYLLVTAHGSTAGKPDYFTVERKDGSISYYGKGNKSQQTISGSGTLSWAVSRYEDSAGNGIDFIYADDDGHRIREINYAYGDAGTPGAKVSFEYEDRTDVIRGYLAGAFLSNDKRMTAIEVLTGNSSLLRRYEFDYLETGYDYLSRIERIRECAGEDGDVCRPDTAFEWRLPAIFFSPNFSTSVQLSSQRDRAAIAPRPVDINGDGRLDIVWQEPDWYEDGSNAGKIAFQVWKYVLATDDGFGPEQVALQDDANVRNPYRWEMLDYNADGRADLAIYIKGEGVWKVFYASTNEISSEDWFFAYGGEETVVTDENARFIDIDGDGLQDAVSSTGYRLLKRRPGALDNEWDSYQFGEEQAWQIEGLESWGELGEQETTSRYLNPDFVGDFDGDGRVDLVLMDTKQKWDLRVDPIGIELKEQHTRAYVVKVQGNKLIAREKVLDFVQSTDFKKKNREENASPQDRHGDLKQKILPADINSDGLTDLVFVKRVLDETDVYKYRLNTGAGFESLVTLEEIPKDVHINWFDYEGDGDVDLVWREEVDGAERLQVRRWQSHLQEFSASEIFMTFEEDRREGQDIFIDMNGDGSTDYLEFHNDMLYVYHSPDRKVAPNVIERIVNGLGAATRITYGSTVSSGHYARLGIAGVDGEECWQAQGPGNYSAETEDWCKEYRADGVHAFYTELNREWTDHHSLGKTGPILEHLGTQFLVTRVESDAPAAAVNPGFADADAKSAVSYFYGRALLQAGGRGLLGFHKIRTVDEQSGIETTTSYRQDFPFLGRPQRTEVHSPDGMLLSEAENTWALHGWQSHWPETAKTDGTAALGPFKPYIAESIEKTYELVGNGQTQGPRLKTVTSTTEQDAHGNVTHLGVTTDAANGDTFTLDTQNGYGAGQRVDFLNPEHNFDGYPELGRLVSSTVTHSRNEGGQSDSAVRTSHFRYYDGGYEAGLLEEEIVEPVDPEVAEPEDTLLRLATRYKYDRFGNKTFAEQSAEGEEPRSSRWIYDIRGRFVEREENGYGQTVNRVVERNDWGQPTLVEDMAGVLNAFSYDVFGRPILEYSGTGAHKVTLFAPAGGQCPAGSVYQRTERGGGGGEVISCFDGLAREVRKVTQGFDGSWIYGDIEYDSHSRVKHQSEPYKASSTRYWTTRTYDLTGRVIGTDLPGIFGSNGTAYDIEVDYEGYTTVTTNPKGQVRRQTANAVGETIQVQDSLENIQEFRHDAQGNLRFVTNKGDGSRSLETEIQYDLRGRKTYMSDPDKGEWHYVYNGYGDLIEQTDAKGQKVLNHYDRLGRLVERIDLDDSGNPVETALWTYNNSVAVDAYGTPPGALREEVQVESGFIRLHSYDSKGRPSETITSLAEGNDHYEKTNYDEYSRPFQVFDAGGDGTWQSSAIQHKYNDYGYLEQVVDAEQVNLATGEQFYTVRAMDARGNVTEYMNGNGVTTERFYDPATGRLLGQTASVLGGENLQELSYSWDELGNLEYREDFSGGKDLREDFQYDGLNRLISSQVTGRTAQTVDYNDLGNIVHKSDVGDYRYGGECQVAAGPHAVCETSDGVSYEYDANGNMVGDSSGRSLQYTTFDKPSLISKGGHTTEFKYGPDRKRYLRVDTGSNGVTETRYIGNVEKVTRPGSTTEIKRYLPGGALVTISGGERQSRYLHKDHLGSLDVITDSTGGIAEDDNGSQLIYSFDAWGQRRNALEWTALLESQLTGFDNSITTRGYTGHEMLDKVGLIHMNGRIYDPRLARFLQADPFVQDPGYSQSHNRYAYVWNNPLNATDPSGYFRLRDWVGLIVAVVGTYICGPNCGQLGYTLVGAASGAASAAANGGNVLQGAFTGAVSAAAFYSVGTAFEGAPAGDFAGSGLTAEAFAGKVVAHGITGGVMAELQGGKFGHGFASAGVTQAFSGAINGIGKGGNYFSAANRTYRIAVAAAVGGTASKLSGGKFANGATTGAFSRAFNDELHDAFKTPDPLTFDDIFDADVGLGVSGGGASLDLEGGAPSIDLNALGETLIPVSIDGSQIKIGKSLGLRHRAEIEAFGVLKTDGAIGVGGQASFQGATVEVQATANVFKPYEWFLKAVPAWLVRSVETVDVRAE